MVFLSIFFLIFGLAMLILTIVSIGGIDTKLMFGKMSTPPSPKTKET
jgi:hypothetical protein